MVMPNWTRQPGEAPKLGMDVRLYFCQAESTELGAEVGHLGAVLTCERWTVAPTFPALEAGGSQKWELSHRLVWPAKVP